MKGIKRAALLTAFLGMVLCGCAGLLIGCEDWLNPDVPLTVTFNLDGGNINGDSAALEVSVNRDASVGLKMPSNPSRSGHGFGGWWTSRGGSGTQFTATTPVYADITVYAKWLYNQYTVTFDADGGSSTTQTLIVNSGASLDSNMPSNPSRSGYSFGGWWTSRNGSGTQFIETTPVYADITVYAKWIEGSLSPVPSDLSLEKSLTWLDLNAAEGGNYTITLSKDESFGYKSLSYRGRTVSLTIKGDTKERTVSLSSTGLLFTVGSGVTLTLGNNVTLQGRSDNTDSLVSVSSGGTLVMESGSKITGNTTSYYGGGVSVHISGTFTMSGGEISGNTSTLGGGVYVSGTFTKQWGGIIYGSNASSTLKNTATRSESDSHAVYVSSGSKKRNSTAGAGVTLDSGKAGSAGGWE
jgi:uncharacterized repeat protein (TIGR02543 family)